MITGSQNIADIFSIFSDGIIVNHFYNGNRLTLNIEILYLARCICRDFLGFTIELSNVKNMCFKTWPSEAGDKERLLVNPAHIFETGLEIMDGKVRNGCIEVICSNPVEEYDFCGGELNFEADTAAVFDDSGRQYSLEELASISKKYLNKWAIR
ncbi:MAG: hypothetical protein HZB37_07965 [Planctomycetes bacterium]|nr:hypothetical protein [Planctomycetota bacterium]